MRTHRESRCPSVKRHTVLPPVIFKTRPILLLLPTTFANAAESALSRIEQSCIQYPTLKARADCKKSKKKNSLCFTRKATGEVVAYFRSTGDGWQARMDSVLRQYVSKHVPRGNAT